jgi:predicted nucleotidyltransferase
MKPKIQGLVQNLVINTSFPPLTYLYRKIYDLSVAVVTLLLRRVDGVLAIYLRRGVAKGEVVYGLSDIDLSIIVKDEDSEGQVAKERVRETYGKLSRVIPLFGQADRELGVYSTSEFSKLYAESDSFKYRFDEGKHTWRLLFGKDVLQYLPQLQDKELYLPATEELKVWWPLLSAEIASSECVRPMFHRKYLWYKAISETSKVYLFICHGERVHHREAALGKIREYLTYEQSRSIDKIQRYMRNLTSKEDLVLDDLMRLFIELTSKAFDEMERKVYEDGKRRKATLSIPSYRDLIVDSRVLDLMGTLEMHVSRELGPCLDYIAMIPQIDFSIDVLHNVDVDSLHVVLVQKDFVAVEKLKGVKLLCEENPSLQSIEPFVTYGNIALSLTAKSWYQCIKSPRQCPLFHSLLSHDRLDLLKERDEMQEKSIQSDLPLFFEEIIQKRMAKIDTTISNKNIYKMKNLDFLRFFWAAARTKLLAHPIESDEVHIPVTSKQIHGMLVQSFPEHSDWLNDLYLEYRKELLGKESNAYRFFMKAIDFLKTI